MRLQSFRFIALLFVGIMLACSQASGQAAASQLNVINQKKLTVYKSDIKGDVVKEGIRGLSVFFSCEYNFTDEEYKQMADRSGKNYFTFSVSLFDKNNEQVYDASTYLTYKRNQPIANHFATTIAFGSQVKTAKPEPRKSTGIELFIPYAQLDLPEGPSEVKVLFNAYAGNSDAPGKKFDNFHLQNFALTKPTFYFVKLIPKQIFVIDKAGKKTEVSQIAEDFSVARGNDKGFIDLLNTGSGIVGAPTSFAYSEGDAMQLRTQRERGTTGQLANRQRPVKGTNGQTVAGFEAGNIQATWPLDLKAEKSLSLKNAAIEVTFAIEKARLPVVRVSEFKINRYTKFEGATGASISFNYEAKVAATLPDLLAVPAYTTDENEKTPYQPLKTLKVMSGSATIDTLGNINLGHGAGGKVEVFFPYASFLYYDETTRKTGPKNFRLDIQLKDLPNRLTQKKAKQSLDVGLLKDAVVGAPVVSKEIIFKQARGIRISIPYSIPSIYSSLAKNFSIQLTEVTATTEEPRLMGLLRKTQQMNDSAKIISPINKNSNTITYQVSQPKGNITLFMPYAGLALTENASPMKFSAKISITKEGAAATPLELGTTATGLKLGLDETKLRFLTLGVSSIRMKDANENMVWRIKSAEGIIYQSSLLPAEKKMENFYAHNYCTSEEDKVIIEVFKGVNLTELKLIAQWEMPVKALKPNETVEIVKEGASPDGNIRSISITYKIN
ncbi:MAG: hypothetical protein V4714_07760 [Bacteroidota bacterium]